MKRIFDLSIAILLVLFASVALLLISILVMVTSEGPVLFWSERVGKRNKIFRMPKFRSMITSTPTVATHLLDNPDSYLSPIGDFLRRSSLDELPQLLSVIKGDMSLVGPRPALYNQADLVALRAKNNVDKLQPGITGWAQVNGRDELSIYQKVEMDIYYLNQQSFLFDIKILWMTFLKVIKRDGISH